VTTSAELELRVALGALLRAQEALRDHPPRHEWRGAISHELTTAQCSISRTLHLIAGVVHVSGGRNANEHA
jgi:hypothetical protein